MGFNDLEAAFKMREVVTSIAESVVKAMRPEPRIATVSYVDRNSKAGQLIFLGESDEFKFRFSSSLGPNIGDVVKVYQRGQVYWVSEILEQAGYGNVGVDLQQVRPRLAGGTSLNNTTDQGVYYGFDSTGVTVAVADCFYLGSFICNSSSIAPVRALIRFWWGESVNANSFATYEFFWQGDDPDGNVWKVVLPSLNSGISGGNGFQLEARASFSQIEFRVRRDVSNGGTFSGLGMGGVQFYGNLIDRDSSVAWGMSVTDTEPTDVFGDIAPAFNELTVASTHYRGPYYDSERITVVRRAQENLNGGGFVDWDGSDLGWTGTFRATIGISDLTTTGYLDMAMPGNGTVIQHHGCQNGSQTVALGLIDMTDVGNLTSSVLYYAPKLRGNGSSVGGRYHLVGNIALTRFNVPSHWIMIAVFDGRGGGYPSLKLGTGIELDHWRLVGSAGQPAFGNGWVNFGGTHSVAKFRKQNGVVHIQGLIKLGTLGTPAFTLPTGFRPDTQILLPSNASAGYGQLGIQATGGVEPNNGSNVNFSINCSFIPGG